jgi:3-methyladenine DNA glycosylase/8-oxoguanine DNA glycosylase
MTIDQAVQRLADFIKSLPDFRVYEQHEIGTYDHIGAAIADAVLQAQRDYDSFVTPRTDRILKRWPEAKTVTAVLEYLKSVPPSDFLDWSDNPTSSNYLAHRVRRFVEILMLLKNSGVETTDDLKQWLTVEEHSAKLSTIYGVGPKTTEYIKILVGLDTAAPDTRLRAFLAQAGIASAGDTIDGEIINRTADLLSIPRSCFDHSIWQYMGAHSGKAAAAGTCPGRI